MHAQPPGPGLPRQAPSVMAWTFFKGPPGGRGTPSGSSCHKLTLEEGVHFVQNLAGSLGVIDLDTKPGAAANSVREIGGELFHLPGHVILAVLDQHRVIR